MDDFDPSAWVQDTLGVDPQSFATPGAPSDDAPVQAAADAPAPQMPGDDAPIDQPVAAVGPADDSVPLQAQGDAGTDAGGGDETPTMNPTSPVPTDITADTAVDFVNAANVARGGGGEVGHMAPDISFKPTFDDAGKVSRVNMTVETSIVRPRWSGGRPNDVNRAAIKQAEALIKAHEERHRDIARAYATSAVKAMHGKTAADAQKAFDTTMKQMDTAQKALDKAEGGIFVKESNGGATVDVALGPAPP